MGDGSRGTNIQRKLMVSMGNFQLFVNFGYFPHLTKFSVNI